MTRMLIPKRSFDGYTQDHADATAFRMTGNVDDYCLGMIVVKTGKIQNNEFEVDFGLGWVFDNDQNPTRGRGLFGFYTAAALTDLGFVPIVGDYHVDRGEFAEETLWDGRDRRLAPEFARLNCYAAIQNRRFMKSAGMTIVNELLISSLLCFYAEVDQPMPSLVPCERISRALRRGRELFPDTFAHLVWCPILCTLLRSHSSASYRQRRQ